MIFKRKLIKVPTPGAEDVLMAVETWVVRWYSSHNLYPHNTNRPEVEVFTSESEAHAFQQALVDALKLLKFTNVGHITVEKNK